MNRHLLILFAAFLVSYNASTQILVGPAFGGHYGWYGFDDSDAKSLYKSKASFNYQAGATISFRVQKRYFLQGSILYSKKDKIIEGKKDNQLLNKAKLRYIDIPISYTMEFKSKVGGGKEYKWYLGAGPVISYWLGGKGVLKNGELNEYEINPPDYTLPYEITFRKAHEDVKLGEMNVEDPNRVQLGLNISAGLVFQPIGYQEIMVTFRYYVMGSFLSRESKGDFSDNLIYQDNLQVRNRQLTMTLHYLLDTKIDQRKKGKSTSKIKRRK